MSILSDVNLVTQFESLGDNCELGLVQRRVGAEPLGLLRFGGMPVRNLVTALAARFEGVGDPAQIVIVPMNDEYMVNLRRYGIAYHADVRIGAADPAALHQQQARVVPFLADKLIADLTSGEKILVFRQNEPLLANDLNDLRQGLAAYGPGVLLWVQAERPGHPAGSVEVIDARLMVGYVTFLAPRARVPDVDVASWITMLRRAHALRPAEGVRLAAAETRPARIDVAFGSAGNAAGYLGAGWSGQENGFCWSIDDRSVIRLPALRPAERFRLEMDVVPFVSPPRLAAQRLRVQINGETVQRFDALPRDLVAFEIPGRLLQGGNGAEIVFEHPDAMSPRQACNEDDDRRLAIAFRSLTLSVVE
ncbi:MAG: hypothetical protein JSS43_32630 [Proteobacteria bacterium]|nr:hypothetical protein [Pseudomonadota bacterium]